MSWAKIDKFYIVLIVTVSLLAILLAFTVKTLFSSFIEGFEIEQTKEGVARVEKEKLERAYKFAFERETVKLELPEL